MACHVSQYDPDISLMIAPESYALICTCEMLTQYHTSLYPSIQAIHAQHTYIALWSTVGECQKDWIVCAPVLNLYVYRKFLLHVHSVGTLDFLLAFKYFTAEVGVF